VQRGSAFSIALAQGFQTDILDHQAAEPVEQPPNRRFFFMPGTSRISKTVQRFGPSRCLMPGKCTSMIAVIVSDRESGLVEEAARRNASGNSFSLFDVMTTIGRGAFTVSLVS